MTGIEDRGITLRKALGDYKTIHMAYRNYAIRTREEYLNDLEALAEFLEKAGINHVKALSLPIIERYIANLEQEGLAGRTRKRKAVAIRSFLSFLYQEGYIDTNIAQKVILPYAESTAPHFLTQAECNRLRVATAKSLRNRAIVELLLQTGIKLSELTRLTLDDIELEKNHTGYMRIRSSRGKKERIIPLNSKATTALKDYLNERKAQTNKTIFLNRFGDALGERGVQKMLRKHLKKAEIGEASIQTLRHTFGTYHIARGTDPKTVQDVMGLKDARYAAIYHTLAKEVVWRELQENAL